MNIEVFRPGDDDCSRLRWRFRFDNGVLSLDAYGIQRRKGGRGRWAGPVAAERWEWMDERRYYSGWSRPLEIPRDVVDEALAQVSIPPVYIGGRSMPAELVAGADVYRAVTA